MAESTMGQIIEESLEEEGGLNKLQGREALEVAPLRQTREGRWEVFFRGEWLSLHRTDYSDDVRTTHGGGGYVDQETKEVVSVPADKEMGENDLRHRYLHHIRFGVRLTKRGFGCVDSFTDG